MRDVLLAQELLDVSTWPTWVVSLLGVVGALLAIMACSTLLGRKKPSVSLPPPSSPRAEKKEQRSALRRGGNPVDVLISDEEARAAPIAGLIIDRSFKGLCLAVEAAVEVGTVLSVRRSNPATPWVRVEVKNCRHASGSFEIGCEFVTTPPASVLMMFG